MAPQWISQFDDVTSGNGKDISFMNLKRNPYLLNTSTFVFYSSTSFLHLNISRVVHFISAFIASKIMFRSVSGRHIYSKMLVTPLRKVLLAQIPLRVLRG